MRLADGAHAISRDLPASSTTVIEVPAGAGDALGTAVHRCSSLLTVRGQLAEALTRRRAPAITIGGDCGVELAAVSHAAGQDVAVLWFDAHPDLNTPESSPSGAFGGMVLRTLLGDGAEELVPEHPLSPSQVVLVGARDIDTAESEYIAESGIAALGCDTSAESLVNAVLATGASRVYIHIDLDVLDPGTVRGLGSPVPFGMPATHLTALLRAVLDRFALAGAGLTAFAPATSDDDDDDQATILRIIAALTR